MTLAKEDLVHHVSRQFNEDLSGLHEHVGAMGRLVAAQLADSIRALVDNDHELAAQVIARDPEVNAMELRIDEECSLVLVRRQPAAGDLRLVFAILKAVTDLERIGDLAKRVAKTAIETASGTVRFGPQVSHLGAMVQAQLGKSLDAFSRLDVSTALQIRQEDRPIDEECKAVTRQLLTYMMEDTRTIGPALSLVWAARSLERIGDHAKNLAEYVFYAVHGKDVRHMTSEERSRFLAAAARPPEA